jgi:hypothetical protein
VWSGSRRASGHSATRIDVNDAATHRVVDAFDVIVNCADASRASPAGLIRYCLQQGKTFVDTSANPRVVGSLVDTLRGHAPGDGTVVLGAGLFPGLSNVMGRAVCEHACDVLEIGIRLNPFSGAGPGTCALMAELLVDDVARFEQQKPVSEPPLRPGPVMAFGDRAVRTVRMPLVESLMLHASAGAATTASYVAFAPAILYPIVALSGFVLPRDPKWRRLAGRIVEVSMVSLRAWLLKGRATSVELVAWRSRTAAAAGEAKSVYVSVADGIRAAGIVVAASIEELRSTPDRKRGLLFADDVIALDRLVSRLRSLGGSRLDVRLVRQ